MLRVLLNHKITFEETLVILVVLPSKMLRVLLNRIVTTFEVDGGHPKSIFEMFLKITLESKASLLLNVYSGQLVYIKCYW